MTAAWCVTVAMVLSGAIRRPLRPTFAYRPHTLSRYGISARR
jgi:hypothetical protein